MDRFICCSAAALLLAACSGSGSGAADAGPVVQATVDLDGVVLVIGDGPAMALLDPNTGKQSKAAWPLFSSLHLDDVVSVSPDGRRVAWLEPSARNGTSLHAAELAFEDGLPTLHELRKMPAGGQGLGWSPDGDRLFAHNLWIDPSAGTSSDCGLGLGSSATGRVIQPLPGGHRYVCTESQTLLDDGLRLTDHASGPPTADGQFLGAQLHVASATFRTPPAASAVGLPLPDGRTVSAPSGIHGRAVSQHDAANTDDVIYTVVTVTDPPAQAAVHDVAAIFRTGTETAPTTLWDVPAGLQPWLKDGDGRRYFPLGTSGDGQRLLYGVQSWVIDDSGAHPDMRTIGSAIVELSRDGTQRGFHVSSQDLWIGVPEAERHFQPELLGRTGVVDLGGGDWLYGVGGSTLSDVAQGSWIGYLDGKPAELPGVGRLSPDGRSFVSLQALAAGPSVCMRGVRGDTALRCLPKSSVLAPFAVLGQGLQSHASGAPVILGSSRGAAWPGSIVTVHGARFGASGTVSVGGTVVPAADVVSWSDTQISFRMSEALPAAGTLQVASAGGASSGGAAVWLTRTALASQPFSHASDAVVAVGQGFNAVDLGELGAFTPVHAPVAMSPAARQADGRYVVRSDGAATPAVVDVPVVSGDFTHLTHFRLENRLADAAKWQVVADQGLAPDAQFVTLAGDLIERSGSLHPLVSERVTFAYGPTLPTAWVDLPGGGAWVLTPGPQSFSQWTAQKLTSWLGPDGLWGTPTYGAHFLAPYFFHGLAADGDTLLLTGNDPAGNDTAAVQFSRDNGATVEPVKLLGAELGSGTLREPILVDAQSGKFFLVFAGSYGAPSIEAVHAIKPDGTATAHVTDVPTGALLDGGTLRLKPPVHATAGGKVLVLFGKTLAFVDFDAPAPHTWSTAPSAADLGHVQSLTHDKQTDDVYAIRDDGSILRATLAGGWKDWAPFDLGIALALPTRVVPVTLDKLPDHRWLVAAQLFDGAPGAASTAECPLAKSGFLVSPAP